MTLSSSSPTLNFFDLSPNTQLEITNSSFELRIQILHHPIVNTDVIVSLGVVEEGFILNLNSLIHPVKIWSIKLELIPLSDDSHYQISPLDSFNTFQSSLISFLKIYSINYSSLMSDLQEGTPIPSAFDIIMQDSISSHSYLTTSSNQVICTETPIDDNVFASFVINEIDLLDFLLPSSVVLFPSHVSLESCTDSVKVTPFSSDFVISDFDIPNSIVNLIISTFILLRLRVFDSETKSSVYRQQSDLLSREILSDYSGTLDISAASLSFGSLPPQIIDQLSLYLPSIGLSLKDLNIPSRFTSDSLSKKLSQIFDISYIPYRSFYSNKHYDSSHIGSFLSFSGDSSQLHLSRGFAKIISPPKLTYSPDVPISYIQLFERLPDKVSSLTLFSYMLRGAYVELSVVVCISIISALVTLLPPIAITYLLSDLIPYSSILPFFEVVALLIVIGFSLFLLQLIQSRFAVRLETKADINIQSAVTSRLLQLPASAILSQNSGDLESRVSYISGLRTIFTSTVTPLFTLSLTLCFNFFLLVYYSWQAAIFILIPVLLLSISALYVGYEKGQLLKNVLEANGRIFSGLFTFLSGILPIRSNLATSYIRLNYLKTARPLVVSLFKATRFGNRLNVLDSVLQPLTYVFIFAIISWVTSNGWSSGISIAVFAGFSAALTTILGATRTLVDSVFGQFIQGYAIWSRSIEFLQIPPEDPNSSVARLNPTGNISFRNISFAYPDSSDNIFSDLSFDIKAGEFIGITGVSGCGKSTLMRIAYAILKPSSGHIYYDNISQSQVNLRALRHFFGVITQDIKLLNASLRDNISAGMDVDDSRILQVIDSVCLSTFVKTLPMGLNTMLSERTNSLSMGQKQLIIIARALLRAPKILFMDEATSYLDMQTESQITLNINRLGITRIAVAHRLSTIQSASKILVLGNNSVQGFDSHDNLLKSCKVYQDLCNS